MGDKKALMGSRERALEERALEERERAITGCWVDGLNRMQRNPTVQTRALLILYFQRADALLQELACNSVHRDMPPSPPESH